MWTNQSSQSKLLWNGAETKQTASSFFHLFVFGSKHVSPRGFWFQCSSSQFLHIFFSMLIMWSPATLLLKIFIDSLWLFFTSRGLEFGLGQADPSIAQHSRACDLQSDSSVHLCAQRHEGRGGDHGKGKTFHLSQNTFPLRTSDLSKARLSSVMLWSLIVVHQLYYLHD